MPRPFRSSGETKATRQRDAVAPLRNLSFLLLLSICTLPSLARAQALRGKLSPAEAAKRTRQRRKQEQCLPQNQEPCGGKNEGILVCEYDDEMSFYASRCVKKTIYAKHLDLHDKNYCGACHKCFQNTDELQSAVHKYVANSTDDTSIAKIYGWPISTWCVDRITDFSHLFSGLHDFNEDVGGWDVRRATSMASTFMNAFSFNGDLSQWNTSLVTDMSLMFDRAYSFQGSGLSNWDTSSVTTLQRAFRIAKKLSCDISRWSTARVTDMSLLFYRAGTFNQPLASWNVERVTDLSYAFAFALEFNQSLIHWKTTSATTTRGMFQSAGSFAQDLSAWNVTQVTDMSYMFSNAYAFNEHVNQAELLRAWDTRNVQHQEQMFGVIAPVFNQTTLTTVTAPTAREEIHTSSSAITSEAISAVLSSYQTS